MYEVENRVPNFDLYPVKTMNDIKANVGVDEIVKTIKNQINKDNYIICFDYYYGINEKVIKDIIEMLNRILQNIVTILYKKNLVHLLQKIGLTEFLV